MPSSRSNIKGSGFGWDDTQKMVTGDRELFDGWCKVISIYSLLTVIRELIPVPVFSSFLYSAAVFFKTCSILEACTGSNITCKYNM